MITLGGMNRTQHTFSLCVFCVTTLVGLASAWAGDWMTYRSTYTHDAYGQRVDQHTRPVEPLSPDQGNLVRSGFRHYRSTIQGSTTADNLHITHEWGRPVMPYEHWRFPYRPFGVPYDQWGPPVPNVLSNFNFQGNNWPVGPDLGHWARCQWAMPWNAWCWNAWCWNAWCWVAWTLLQSECDRQWLLSGAATGAATRIRLGRAGTAVGAMDRWFVSLGTAALEAVSLKG